MTNFWHDYKTPFLVLAPMEDVTDTVFREVVMSVSSSDALHVLFTEFTSTDGMCHERGRDKVMERLMVNQSELELLKARNIKLVAQIWGGDPENFRKSAMMISEMGVFDGIDINMGCPVKKVVKQKSCANLINYPDLAGEIIQATSEATKLPVSVKTRIGFSSINTESWIGHLLEASPKAITIHGRTRKMMSNGPALWDEIGKAVTLRNQMKSPVTIIGNGEVGSYADAMNRVQQYGVDGVMIGTGIFRNPWLFNKEPMEISCRNRVSLLRFHISLFRDTWGDGKDYNVLKRFYKIYLNGFPGAAHWRDQFMRAHHYDDVLILLNSLEKEVIHNESIPSG
ncbi:MAG: tRNA-dihydrouridine synthase [Bacteroidales bacterium]|nr:tRNA-dihydrouridine synthase [Bacteroidales bacterium]